MPARILDLIDFAKVDTLLEGFNKSTGFATAILDLEGNVLSKSGWRQICTEFHRIHPETAKGCLISDTVLANEMSEGKKYYFYQCLNGLVDVAVPIVIKGEHIANLFSGQFFFEEPDNSFFQKQAAKYGFNIEIYLKALKKVPVVSKEKVIVAMDFLQNMTQMISEMTFQKLEQMLLNEAIQKSEQILRLFVEHSPASIAMFDNNMRYLVASSRFLTDYNLGNQDLIGRSHYEVFPEISERWKDIHRRCLAGETISNSNDPFPRADRKTDWVRWEIHPWYEAENQIGGIILFSEVITQQVEAREALRESEKYNRMLFEQSAIGLMVASLNGKLVDINPTFANIIGRTIEETKSLTYWDITPISYQEQEQVQLDLLAKTGHYGPYEKEYIHKDGHLVPVRLQGLIIERNNEKFIWSSVEDISERKQTETQLLESESKYRYLFENNPAPMWIYDLETLRFLEVNDTAIILYGYSREEFLSMTLKNIRPEEDIETLLKDVEQTVTPFNKAGIWRHIKKNGEIIFVEITSHRIEFEERPARMVIINDISERKKIEESLVESENSLKEAQKIANMGDWELDLIANKSKWSENSYRLYGLEPFEIIPTYDYFRSRVHPDDLHLIDEAYVTLLQTKSSVEQEIRITFPDNRIKWIVNKIIPVFVDDKIVLLKGINIDITEKKEAEKQLRLLSKSIEQSPVSMVITDVNGTIEYTNPSFSKTTGFTKEEALGKNPRMLKSGMHDASFYEEMWKILLSGQPWIGEILNMKKNGELYWENAIISPILNTNGVITHFLAAKEDITEKKNLFSDLIKEKERAEESDRLKSAFLANMSHEVRTPLNSIIGFSELLTDPDFEEDQKNEFIRHIISNGNNLLTIISDIMDISKLESGELEIYKKQINVPKFVSALIEQFAVQTKAKELEFKVAFPDNCDTFIFFADEDRLRQIFLNLIGNALKFTSKGNIEIGCTKKDNSIEFYVKDSGIGIPAEYHDKIFDRFRQVEDAKTRKYGGNGLGLAITKSLVELMGGKIWIESEYGKGSTFYFSLPLKP